MKTHTELNFLAQGHVATITHRPNQTGKKTLVNLNLNIVKI